MVVHAGDPDREGQLLVDEVLDFLKLSAVRRKKVRRLLVNDLNGPAVKKALERLQDKFRLCASFCFPRWPAPGLTGYTV